ncbi:MAG TPA: hypothetical protein ENJ40_07640 [Thermosulfurimonas dismutans]|uniref:DUF2802 domain-containing protein n=1 Tax=Thermosulfurimonas dismutans TaxID=999894 RepID=A0A7C3CKZ4_9BACT|nr:hypothetical protein [Thermosulfurimonas dismutans]
MIKDPVFWQFVLDLLLLVAILVLFLRIRRMVPSSLREVVSRLEILERLSEDLARYLEEERRIYARLERALGAGVQAWEGQEEERRTLKEKVLRDYRQGMGVKEIARRYGLSEGEVELLISLERFRSKK